MNRFVKSIFDLNALEQVSRRQQWPNHVHPAIKIVVSLIYILFVTNVHKYALGNALLFGIYPILMVSIAEIPLRDFAGKLMIPAAVSIGLGLFNPLIDRQVLLVVGNVHVSGGWISLMTLFVKAILTISATLILVSTTSIEDLGRGMSTLKLPDRLIILLLLMYRYIGILLAEVNRTMEAYQLRSSDKKGIHYRAWGSLVGQIMIRSYRRSEEIYNAMQLRGYKAGGR